MAGRKLRPPIWLNGTNTPQSQEKPRVAVLVGATAAGKTAVALALAQGLGAEIVNADSLQVYRELDIGTAKPSLEERALAPHHLIDVADPPETYDAARYCPGRAGSPGRSLRRRGVPPLVVGGTGLYLKALLSGLFAEGEPAGRGSGTGCAGSWGTWGCPPSISACSTWTRPPPPGSTPTTPTGSSGPWR